MGDSSRIERRRSSLPMLGVGALAIPLVAFGVAPRLLPSPLSVRSAQSLAAAQGLFPAENHPALGASIYQWDPELADIPALDLGHVTDRGRPLGKKPLVEVKSERKLFNVLYLDIRPDGLRYWVRR